MSVRRRIAVSFSLRTLMIVCAVVCVSLAGLTNVSWQQRSAVNKIHQLGGSVEYADHGRFVAYCPALLGRVTHVNLGLYTVESANWLQFTSSTATDADVARIMAALPYVEDLNLDCTSVTDGVVEPLASCRRLKSVRLWSTAVSDEGLARLRAKLPNCDIQRDIILEVQCGDSLGWRGSYYLDLIAQ